jgi:hypothetical protein
MGTRGDSLVTLIGCLFWLVALAAAVALGFGLLFSCAARLSS